MIAVVLLVLVVHYLLIRTKIPSNWIRCKTAFFQHLSRQFIFQLVLRNKFQPWNLLFNVRRPLLKSNEKRTFISMSTNISLKNSRCLFFCWKLSRSKDLENHKSPLSKMLNILWKSLSWKFKTCSIFSHYVIYNSLVIIIYKKYI